MSDARGRRQRRAADGREGDEASDFSLSQVLCKAWKTPLGWQASVSPAGLECEVGEINSIQLGNAMQIATYGEWERNTKRPVKTSHTVHTIFHFTTGSELAAVYDLSTWAWPGTFN